MTLHSPSQSLHFAGLASSGLTLQDVLGACAVREIIMLPSHRFRQTVDGKLDIILVDESQMYSLSLSFTMKLTTTFYVCPSHKEKKSMIVRDAHIAIFSVPFFFLLSTYWSQFSVFLNTKIDSIHTHFRNFSSVDVLTSSPKLCVKTLSGSMIVKLNGTEWDTSDTDTGVIGRGQSGC